MIVTSCTCNTMIVPNTHEFTDQQESVGIPYMCCVPAGRGARSAVPRPAALGQVAAIGIARTHREGGGDRGIRHRHGAEKYRRRGGSIS